MTFSGSSFSFIARSFPEKFLARLVLDDNNLTHPNAHVLEDNVAVLLHTELSSDDDDCLSKAERVARHLHLANRFISARLTRCLALETLSLAGCSVTDAFLLQLVEALELHTMALVRLRLGHNDIKCEGATKLARFLAADSHLRHLDLRHNEISDLGSAALGNSLKHNSSLLQLNLKENQISDTSAFVCSILKYSFFAVFMKKHTLCFQSSSRFKLWRIRARGKRVT